MQLSILCILLYRISQQKTESMATLFQKNNVNTVVVKLSSFKEVHFLLAHKILPTCRHPPNYKQAYFPKL